MIAPVSAATKQALQDAMERLLAGHALKTDGRMTAVNLAIEAGVSRATANRATELLADYRRRAAAIQRARGQELEVARAGSGEESRNAHILAQHIQLRALHKRQEEQRASRADVLRFRRKSDDVHNNKKGGETL
jgi:homoaconitase/3-isopropylmalate dehydratase large subunit